MQVKATASTTAHAPAWLWQEDSDKCWRGCGAMGTPTHGWWGCNMAQRLWKTVRRPLKPLNTQFPYDPAVPLFCLYPTKMKTCLNKTLRMNVYSSIINNSQEVEATQMPISWWVSERKVVYTRSAVLCSREKNGGPVHAATWVAGKNVTVSERSQTRFCQTVLWQLSDQCAFKKNLTKLANSCIAILILKAEENKQHFHHMLLLFQES